MQIIKETELIITETNKIYHLNLSKEQIADDIILVGDPNRVDLISNKFDVVEHRISNREFKTHTGLFKGKKLSVISTGIGTDNIDIVINELDALVNIDFKTRTINKTKKSLNLIRLGTSGALQKNIEVDTLIASSYALGFDGLAYFYKKNNRIYQDMTKAYQLHANWPNELAQPYCIRASNILLDQFLDIDSGITATAPGFYGPQGRALRLNPNISNMHQIMSTFRFNNHRITNFEMETSALYYLGQSLNHNTLTICAIIGNRLSKKYSKDHKKIIDRMINYVLKKLC